MHEKDLCDLFQANLCLGLDSKVSLIVMSSSGSVGESTNCKFEAQLRQALGNWRTQHLGDLVDKRITMCSMRTADVSRMVHMIENMKGHVPTKMNMKLGPRPPPEIC